MNEILLARHLNRIYILMAKIFFSGQVEWSVMPKVALPKSGPTQKWSRGLLLAEKSCPGDHFWQKKMVPLRQNWS